MVLTRVVKTSECYSINEHNKQITHLSNS